MTLYSHRNAANNRHIIKHREKIHKNMTVTIRRYDDNYTCSDDDDTKKQILTLAANMIQYHGEPWRTCKISYLKVPVSACHVTSNTWNVNSIPDISDISRNGTAKNSKHHPVERMVQHATACRNLCSEVSSFSRWWSCWRTIPTSDAPPPSYSPNPSTASFTQFQSVTVNDVIAAVHALPDKTCMHSTHCRQLI